MQRAAQSLRWSRKGYINRIPALAQKLDQVRGLPIMAKHQKLEKKYRFQDPSQNHGVRSKSVYFKKYLSCLAVDLEPLHGTSDSDARILLL